MPSRYVTVWLMQLQTAVIREANVATHNLQIRPIVVFPAKNSRIAC